MTNRKIFPALQNYTLRLTLDLMIDMRHTYIPHLQTGYRCNQRTPYSKEVFLFIRILKAI